MTINRRVALAVGLAATLLAGACQSTVTGQAAPGPTATTTTPAVSTGPLRFRTVTKAVVAQVVAPAPAGPAACWNVPAAAGATLPARGSAAWTALVARCVALRQNSDAAAEGAAFQALVCAPGDVDVLADRDDPARPLVACDRAGTMKYLLGAAFLDGGQVADATVGRDPNGADWVVNLTFRSAGAKTWANYTAANVGQTVAVMVDTQVVSAPTVDEAIPGGNTQIAGNFTQAQAQQLADRLTGR
jgi:preprotein translocase subunit SecD